MNREFLVFRLLFCCTSTALSEVPDIFPVARDRRLATTGKGVVLRVPTPARVVGWRVPTCGLPHTSSKSDQESLVLYSVHSFPARVSYWSCL